MKEKAYGGDISFQRRLYRMAYPGPCIYGQCSLIGAGHGQRTVCSFFCPGRALTKTKTRIKSSKDNDSIKEKRIMVIRETKRKHQTLKTKLLN